MSGKLKSRSLTAKQVQELLKKPGWAPDPELSSGGSSPAYKHSDGRILVVFENGKGKLGESREALLKLITAVGQQKPVHLLSGRLPQGKEFVTEVPKLIDQLAMNLGIPRNELDKSEGSLDIVDKAIKRIGRRKSMKPEVFAPLVAYVGEVIRQAVGGEWELRLAADGETWEPWIVRQNSRDHPPFAIVFRELYEGGKSASIRGAVHGQIRSHLLGE